MELFYLEHRKLWRRKSVRISVLLCFVYVVLFASVLSYQWFSFGSSNDDTTLFGNDFDGYANIRSSQEYAKEWGGELTGETLQKMVMDYQRLEAEERWEELNRTDWQKVNGWLRTLWPELEKPEVFDLMISYAEPEKLTGFYAKRQKAVEEFLEISGQTGKEKEYLLQMNRKVQEPFRYEWVEGWSQLLGSGIADLGVVMALFLAIALSTVFAGEWHDNTGALILTAKNGRKRIAGIKICSGLAFTVEFFTILAAGSITAQIFCLGTEGWDMPIQCIKLIAVAPMNLLQAEIFEYAFALLGAIGFAGAVMLISAAVKSNFAAVLISLAVAYLPMMVAEYLPVGVQKALDLLPLAGSATDIFRTNTFCVFGKIIWSPYLLISVPLLLGVFCIPFAVGKWARNGKA